MIIDLNNKKFKSEFNSKNGEVSNQTIFSYHQKDRVIWAEYNGGAILKGNLIGKVIEKHIEFVYQHINRQHELMTGRCISYPEYTDNGKIRLKEHWQWTCGDHSAGESVLIEI